MTGLQGCRLFLQSVEHLGGDSAWTTLLPCVQLLTVTAKLGKLDPTQCCWNCEAEVFKNQEKPYLWLSAQLADAHCTGSLCQPSVVSCGIKYRNLHQNDL